jgi:hypothetical protein
MDTKSVVEKVLQEQLIDPAKASYEAVKHPIATAESIASRGYEAVRHPRRTAEQLYEYYKENPDYLGQDVVLTVFGGPEAKAAEAAESIPSRLQSLGKEGAAPVPADTPIPAPTAREGYKAVGKGISEVKETAGPFPAEGILPVMEDIRKNLKTQSYDRSLHKSVSAALGHMDRLLAKQTTTDEALENLGQQATAFGAISPQAIAQAKAKVRLETMESGGKYTFHDVENAFDTIRKATAAKDKQSAMGAMMENKLEDHVKKLPGGEDYLQRRSTYSQAKKLETVKRIKEKADLAAGRRYTQAGIGHALSTAFNDEIASKPRELKRWTPEEQKFIKDFAGRRNWGERAARFFGRAAPTSWGGLVLNTLITSTLGGVPAAITAGAGLAGRGVEKIIAGRKLRQFEDLVAREAGGNEEKLRDVIGPDAHAKIKGSEALRQWKKRATRTTTRALAISIARAANMPQLVPRIEGEINGLQQTND